MKEKMKLVVKSFMVFSVIAIFLYIMTQHNQRLEVTGIHQVDVFNGCKIDVLPNHLNIL